MCAYKTRIKFEANTMMMIDDAEVAVSACPGVMLNVRGAPAQSSCC